MLGRTIERQGTQYVVEADIKAFFDNVDQDQLMAFLAHRVADKRVLRYIRRFLKASAEYKRMAFTGPVTGGPLREVSFRHYWRISTSTTRWTSGFNGDSNQAVRGRRG